MSSDISKESKMRAAVKQVKAETGVEARAMLVSCTISTWSAVRTDSKATHEVAEQHQSRKDMGQYRKSLVDPMFLKPIADLYWKVSRTHHRLTVPWKDGGERLLSSQGYFRYTEEMRKAIEEFNAEVRDNIIPNYSEWVEKAKQPQPVGLVTLFNAADYPSPQEIASKYRVATTIDVMPSAQDFRVNLGNVETERLKREIELFHNQRLAESMKDPWRRLQEVVSKMVERLNAYSEITVGGKTKVERSFRESLVTNITEVLDLIPILNITGDATLEAFRVRIAKELTQYPSEALKGDEKKRKATAKAAEDIMKKMASFI
jgi:hypothetical protein